MQLVIQVNLWNPGQAEQGKEYKSGGGHDHARRNRRQCTETVYCTHFTMHVFYPANRIPSKISEIGSPFIV